MTTNEPGWVAENQLADRLGWEIWQLNRKVVSLEESCGRLRRFRKNGVYVYRVPMLGHSKKKPTVWVRAEPLGTRKYRVCESYPDIESALEGKANE